MIFIEHTSSVNYSFTGIYLFSYCLLSVSLIVFCISLLSYSLSETGIYIRDDQLEIVYPSILFNKRVVELDEIEGCEVENGLISDFIRIETNDFEYKIYTDNAKELEETFVAHII